MEAIVSMKSIYEMLASLTDTNKKWLADHLYQDIADKNATNKREAVSDEELAARLSQFPSWDEMEHADLSAVDYNKYKPYRSSKTVNNISKWLYEIPTNLNNLP